MFCAIENESIEIVKILLDCPQIDVNAKVILDNTYPILSADFSSSAMKLAKSIVKSPETIFNSEENLREALKISGREELNAFHLAIDKKNTEIVKLLLSHPKLDINIKSIFRGHFIEGKLGSKKLIEFNRDYAEENAFHLAFRNKSTEIINLLIERPEFDINSKLIEIDEFAKHSLLSLDIFLMLYYGLPSILSSLSGTKIPLDRQV